MTAHLEEIISHTYSFNAKQPLPEFAKLLFNFGAWGNVVGLACRSRPGGSFDLRENFGSVIGFDCNPLQMRTRSRPWIGRRNWNGSPGQISRFPCLLPHRLKASAGSGLSREAEYESAIQRLPPCLSHLLKKFTRRLVFGTGPEIDLHFRQPFVDSDRPEVRQHLMLHAPSQDPTT